MKSRGGVWPPHRPHSRSKPPMPGRSLPAFKKAGDALVVAGSRAFKPPMPSRSAGARGRAHVSTFWRSEQRIRAEVRGRAMLAQINAQRAPQLQEHAKAEESKRQRRGEANTK